MTNSLEEAINSNDGDHAATVIQEELGIESDDVANYVFPKTWPSGPSGYSAWPLAISTLATFVAVRHNFKLGERHDGKPRAAQGASPKGRRRAKPSRRNAKRPDGETIARAELRIMREIIVVLVQSDH